jgi:hypothetical protein
MDCEQPNQSPSFTLEKSARSPVLDLETSEFEILGVFVFENSCRFKDLLYSRLHFTSNVVSAIIYE